MAAEHKNPVTLSRFILAEQQLHPDARGDFTILLSSITLACKVISNACTKAGIFKLYGLDGSKNTSGDAVKKLDVFANDCFIDSLMFCNRASIMVSEENDQPIYNPDCVGKYFVAFDPLDGSSNIDANVSIGTIFGIWMNPEPGNPTKLENVLQPGRKLVAAGYAMYGAASMMVLSTGNGVHGFTLDPSLGEYILTHRDIKCPMKGAIYSINEGNASLWDVPTTEFVKQCKEAGAGKKPKSARYVGSMVADVHRTLLYGGIFMYPGSKTDPKGKLRLLYECAPMAFLLEHAGGKASSGKERILNIVPKSIHERSPIFLGSAEDIDAIERLYKSVS